MVRTRTVIAAPRPEVRAKSKENEEALERIAQEKFKKHYRVIATTTLQNVVGSKIVIAVLCRTGMTPMTTTVRCCQHRTCTRTTSVLLRAC